MRKISTLILLALIVAACNSAKRTEKVEKIADPYVFQQETVITGLYSDHCLEGYFGRAVELACKAEEKFIHDLSLEIPAEQELAFGAAFHEKVKKRYSLLEDEKCLRLRKLLSYMRPYLERKEVNYQVFLLEDTSIINAWTVPGGYIYLTTGLLGFVSSEAELAFILGHEIGHHENEHTLKHMRREKIAKDFFEENGEEMATAFGKMAVAYGQAQELAADRVGAYLAFRAGFEPSMGLHFFAKLEDGEVNPVLDRLLFAHPYPEERMACLRNYLEECRNY